jgi:hypothetical protein
MGTVLFSSWEGDLLTEYTYSESLSGLWKDRAPEPVKKLSLAVKISVMTGKLVEIPAINTNTPTNEFCQKMRTSSPKCICWYCYSYDMLEGSRKNCQPAWEHNSLLLKSGLLSEIPRFNSLYVRFDGHGELINETHFINYLLITEHNPKSTFSLYTKRRDIVKSVLKTRKKPQNLILVYSNPLVDRITDKIPYYFDKVFNTTTEKSTRDNCTGRKCIECLACYQFDGNSVLIEQKKKRA